VTTVNVVGAPAWHGPSRSLRRRGQMIALTICSAARSCIVLTLCGAVPAGWTLKQWTAKTGLAADRDKHLDAGAAADFQARVWCA
jgi:hypothetical protein